MAASIAVLKNDKFGKDIWSGKSFGFYQLLHYVASSAGMIFYLVHFLLGGPIAQRVSIQGKLELILLITRWMNEFYFDKWGIGDIFHHLTMVVSYYLVFYEPSCIEFGWALCQMQILHIPMLLWYLGCRRGCYAASKSVIDACTLMFPYAWILSVSYRASIMLSTGYYSVITSKPIATTAIISFAIVLSYLDITWTTYFFTELKWPQTGGTLKLAQGLYIATFFSSAVTIFLITSMQK